MRLSRSGGRVGWTSYRPASGHRTWSRRRSRQRPVLGNSARLAAAVVIVAVIGALSWAARHGDACSGCGPGERVAMTVVYNAPTANVAAIDLDAVLGEELRAIGRAHESIRLVRVEGDGATTSEFVDLTPRVDGKPDGEVLKVPERAPKQLDATIATLEERLNGDDAKLSGQSLYLGLSTTDIDPSVPLVIVSTGLDSRDPLSFIALNFKVTAEDALSKLKALGELPKLRGAAVHFVVVPSAGNQAALRQPQRRYREQIWRALLVASGAKSVRFSYPSGGPALADTQSPTVPLPPLPSTPIRLERDPKRPGVWRCRVDSDTFFDANEADLLDREVTKRALRPCLQDVQLSTSVVVEGHTMYTGRPNNQDARKLSERRAQVLADLLIELGVKRQQIKRIHGFGNAKPPFPNPRDPRNRSVVVTFIDKQKGTA